MSSTNRGGQREVSDYYFTAIPPILQMLKFLANEDGLDLPALKYLDPCAGGHDGSCGVPFIPTKKKGEFKVPDKGLMSYPEALQRMNVPFSSIRTYDIRTDSLAEFKGTDYLNTEIEQKFDVVISNPPFSLAQGFIEKGHKETKDGGYVIMLLRLNYFGSRTRQVFWSKYMPKYTFVHAAPRMSFSNAPGTDSIEYAHMIWQKGSTPRFSQLILGYLEGRD